MKTLSIKFPKALENQLDIFSRKKGMSKSAIVRNALLEYFSQDGSTQPGSFLDLAHDLAGSIDGPPDLSTNKTYLEGYGK